MEFSDWQAEQFERNRAHLRAVAYRMLGSTAEAEDAVQEAWFRLDRSDAGSVENLRAWLTTIVSRICFDMLRARNSRREELVDGWFSDPMITIDDENDPEHEALMADSVGLALMVVLETLSPAERLAFVLHDMFGVPFDEIAPIVERNVEATRQLASRARRRVRGAREPQAASLAEQRRVVDAFLAAARGGDFGALLAVLDPDVVFRSDITGGLAPGPDGFRGAEAVAGAVLERAPRFASLTRPAIVDGAAGLVAVLGKRVIGVIRFTISEQRLRTIELVADERKLARIRI
jgi:RNA polymerase sigma-70 factor, ECF subfamily